MGETFRERMKRPAKTRKEKFIVFLLAMFVLGMIEVGYKSMTSESKLIPKASYLDAVTYAVKDYWKENANDPKSIKYVDQSEIFELSNGMFAQRVKIRAKNSFGGVITNENIYMLEEDRGKFIVSSVGSIDEFYDYLDEYEINLISSYDYSGKKIKDY